VQDKWAPDPQLQPLSLHARQLVNNLSILLRRSIFYLKRSDPVYLRGNTGAGASAPGRQPLGCSLEHLGSCWYQVGSGWYTSATSPTKLQVTHSHTGLDPGFCPSHREWR
jgi:hypothetical protein